MLKVQTPLYGNVKLMTYHRSGGETPGFIFANSKAMFVKDRRPAPIHTVHVYRHPPVNWGDQQCRLLTL